MSGVQVGKNSQQRIELTHGFRHRNVYGRTEFVLPTCTPDTSQPLADAAASLPAAGRQPTTPVRRRTPGTRNWSETQHGVMRACWSKRSKFRGRLPRSVTRPPWFSEIPAETPAAHRTRCCGSHSNSTTAGSISPQRAVMFPIRPRMHALPPITSGFCVIRFRCVMRCSPSKPTVMLVVRDGCSKRRSAMVRLVLAIRPYRHPRSQCSP